MTFYLKIKLIIYIIIGLNNALVCTSIYTCKNKVQNYINASSDPFKNNEVVMKNFGGVLYREDGITPSCYNGRPSVIMPGVIKLTHGELKVSKKYDLIKSGILKMTVINPKFKDPLCLNGESQYLALPNNLCFFELCPFIGNELCEFLSNPGTHTIDDLEKKLKFNTTLLLPEPPSVFGISLLDFFSGEFSFGFILEHKGKQILDVQIPINHKFLQVGLNEEDESFELDDENLNCEHESTIGNNNNTRCEVKQNIKNNRTDKPINVDKTAAEIKSRKRKIN